MVTIKGIAGRLQKYFQDQPPDLISLIKKFFAPKGDVWQSHAGKGKIFKGANGHTGRYIGIIFIVIAILWALSGIYIVAPAEQAVVLRFGRYIDTVNPGPHWIARFIDTKTTLNVQQISNFNYSSEMLTKDENIVSVSLAVQYRIQNPEQVLFNVVNPVNALHQATSSALRQIVGQMTLDAVLTTGREELRKQVSAQLNKTLKIYNTGLAITDVVLQPAKPPEAVVHAFDDAIKAREDEQTSINQAEAYNRKEIAIVKGSVARIQQDAEAYKKQVVFKANGDTARYLALLKPYDQSPFVTGKRLYIDTVSDVLSHTTNILVDSGGSNVLYLPIDKIFRNQMAALPKLSDQVNNESNPGNKPSAGVLTSESSAANNSYSYAGRPSYDGGNR